MDLMGMGMATQPLMRNLGGNAGGRSESAVAKALGGLLGGGSGLLGMAAKFRK